MKKKLCFFLLFVLAMHTILAQSTYPDYSPNSDCASALLICSKGTYLLEDLSGGGTELNEIANTTCLGQDFIEKKSAWIKWEVGKAGYLEFDLTPLQLHDDLDFALFQIEAGPTECSTRKLIRCVASGKNLGAPSEDYQACLGPTGIRKDQNDIAEDRGCGNEDDNFAAPIYVQAGENYALFIHNYTSAQGVIFNLYGTAQLKLERDLAIAMDYTETDNKNNQYTFSSLLDGGIVLGIQQWHFGEGAIPSFAQGSGPHLVQYSTSGLKHISTKIQSPQGCMLSAVAQLDALTSLNSISATDVGFELFPNPTLGRAFLQVHPNLTEQWAQLYLIDVQGRVLHTQSEYLKNVPIEIDLSIYAPGTYLLRLETSEENYLKKLVKQ